MLTGPKASTSCGSDVEKGSSHFNKTGLTKEDDLSNLVSPSYATSIDFFNCSIFSFNISTYRVPPSEPIRVSLLEGSPILVFANRSLIASVTSLIRFLGTIVRRIAVHFCPAFDVISIATSFTNNLNSSILGVMSGPKTDALSESASKLNLTELRIMLGWALSFCPVAAEPVKVTTS